MRLQTPEDEKFPKAVRSLRFRRPRDDDLDSNDPSFAQRSCGEGEEKMEKNESSGGEVQRVYSAIGGVPVLQVGRLLSGYRVRCCCCCFCCYYSALQSTSAPVISRFCSFVFASYYFLLFSVLFFFYFRVEPASRARWRRRRSVGFTPVDDPLIYRAHLSTTTSFTAT